MEGEERTNSSTRLSVPDSRVDAGGSLSVGGRISFVFFFRHLVLNHAEATDLLEAAGLAQRLVLADYTGSVCLRLPNLWSTARPWQRSCVQGSIKPKVAPTAACPAA
jgi:hypothetical protein